MFLEKLKECGHTIQVLTGFPNYPEGKIYPGYTQKMFHREDRNGISVIRTPLYPSHDANPVRRVANYTSFALSSAPKTLSNPASPVTEASVLPANFPCASAFTASPCFITEAVKSGTAFS